MDQNISNIDVKNIEFDPNNIIVLTRKISAILESEIALLKKMKLAEIHQFYDEKIAIASILEGYKELISQNEGILDAIPERTRHQLKQELERFEALAEEDGKQIRRAQEVHKLVMEAVKTALEKNTMMSMGYTNKGTIGIGGSTSYVTPPVSVNENI